MAYVEYENPREHIAVVRLNRPERRNSMSRDLMADLAKTWDRFVNDDEAWVAILTGTGTSFCAGMDLKEAKEAGRAGGQHPIQYPFIPETDKPIVSAVNGFAMGGGFVMGTSCDFGVVADDALLQLTEIQLGVLGGWDLGLRNRVPVVIANEMSLLGAPFNGRRAYEVGLFNRCVPRDQVLDAALELADRLVSLPPRSVRAMKRILRGERPQGTAAGWDIYHSTRDELATAEDTREAVQAFNEKRKPVFTGR